MLFFPFFRPQLPLSSLENRALLSTSVRKRRVRGSPRPSRDRLPRSRSRKTRSQTGSFGTRRHLSRQSSTGSQLTTTPCTSVRTEYDYLLKGYILRIASRPQHRPRNRIWWCHSPRSIYIRLCRTRCPLPSGRQ